MNFWGMKDIFLVYFILLLLKQFTNISAFHQTKIKIKYHFSVDIALKRAKERDDVGKRTKWFLPGGPERQEATELYRQAAVISEYVSSLKRYS